jgi:heme-degrading monooxygenase HmoA
MATIPWTSTAFRSELVADGTAATTTVVQVSRLELQRRRSVPGFMIAALRLRRDVLRADGALGVSLIAQPLRRTFWTLSAWTDAEAIAAFTRSGAHRAVMRNYRAEMRGSHFHTWFGGDVTQRPSWADARARLEQS